MNNEQLPINTEEEIEINEVETDSDAEELKLEIESLKSRADLLVKDNAELISDNLALRAKIEALLEARAALPEFSVKTEERSDKYGNVREAFKNNNPFIKRR
ncbi:MAG: hypothetical protein FWH08_03155 [Oscillospiraceae bacterium]|nr:hypothetical protein [Oscillospiraceae bacterium]